MANEASVRSIAELVQFGQNLKTTGDNLITLFEKLRGQMHRVCEGWNDQKNQAFMADFERKVQDINKMSHEMQTYAQFIARSVQALEQYKNTR